MSAALTLCLLRHAKAEPADGRRDFDRPLAARGREDCARIAAALAGARFDLALVSPAARTKETFERVAALLASPPPVRLVRALYDASAGMIADEIRAIEPGPRAALVVGHNPGVWALARMLAGAGMPGEMRGLEAGFRPGEFASIAFDADDWADVEPGAGRLLALFDPAGE